jgi:hypothetical protein
MATTTTNFGWDIPQSTDLVKDGATAIAALGQDIDTALVDLKGGTTGQVLAKASATDLDYSWVAQDDSNAIQNAIVDAKGDLIAASAADTPARLAVGTNGQVLTADSTAGTGLAWATPSTATTVGCILYSTTNQTLANNTETVITFNSELLDTNSFHDTSTNTSRITIPAGKAGKYYIYAWSEFGSSATGYRQLQIIVNGQTGTPNRWAKIAATGSANNAFNLASCAILAVGDYLELEAYQNSGGNLTFFQGVSDAQFGVIFLGA